MSSDAAEYAVADAPESERFEVRSGDELVGFSQYKRSGHLIALLHTEVSDEYEGKGVASRLISAALDTARNDGLEVLPFCPFVRDYIERHPDEYLGLVPENLRTGFQLPAANR